MSEIKKEIRWFSIMDYEKEGKYLSKRHLEGWKFKNVTFELTKQGQSESNILIYNQKNKKIKLPLSEIICTKLSDIFPTMVYNDKS